MGVYILLRGHNMPGGGFIAGLIIGVALIMQYMASGYAWADRQMRVDYHALIGLGVLLAGVTGVGAWYGDLPFLTSGYDYFHLPLVGEVELATAMALRPRRVPDRGRRGHADLANLSHRPQGGAAAGGRGADGHRPAGGGPVDGVPGRQRGRARHRGRHLLVLRAQTFPVVLKLTFLSYAVNVYLFAMGRLAVGQPPIVTKTATGYTDPDPGAGLTAIVISSSA